MTQEDLAVLAGFDAVWQRVSGQPLEKVHEPSVSWAELLGELESLDATVERGLMDAGERADAPAALDEAKFRAFVTAYLAAGGRVASDPADLYDSRRNHLDWLAYNARRALFDDPEERQIGRIQIADSLHKLAWDQRNRAKILAWMEEALHS